MMRVNRANKCPICGHDTWCLLGRTVVLCMRVPSEKPKVIKGGETAYIHEYGDNPKPVLINRKRERVPVIDVKKVIREWNKAYGAFHDRALMALSVRLGVSVKSLEALEFTRGSRDNWGIPMKDGFGGYIGMRMRSNSGAKWALTGSQAGIFIPLLPVGRRVLIVEGPTDTAAALTIGFYAIGRPSCSGGVQHIMTFVQRHFIREAVIVSDNDDPGIKGAVDLQRQLSVPSCILLLPTKDLREYLRLVGDKSTIDSMIQQLVWTQPNEKQ